MSERTPTRPTWPEFKLSEYPAIATGKAAAERAMTHVRKLRVSIAAEERAIAAAEREARKAIEAELDGGPASGPTLAKSEAAAAVARAKIAALRDRERAAVATAREAARAVEDAAGDAWQNFTGRWSRALDELIAHRQHRRDALRALEEEVRGLDVEVDEGRGALAGRHGSIPGGDYDVREYVEAIEAELGTLPAAIAKG